MYNLKGNQGRGRECRTVLYGQSLIFTNMLFYTYLHLYIFFATCSKFLESIFYQTGLFIRKCNSKGKQNLSLQSHKNVIRTFYILVFMHNQNKILFYRTLFCFGMHFLAMKICDVLHENNRSSITNPICTTHYS